MASSTTHAPDTLSQREADRQRKRRLWDGRMQVRLAFNIRTPHNYSYITLEERARDTELIRKDNTAPCGCGPPSLVIPELERPVASWRSGSGCWCWVLAWQCGGLAVWQHGA